MLKAVGLLIVVACQRVEPPPPVAHTLPTARAGRPLPEVPVVFVGSDGTYEVALTYAGARTPVLRAEQLDETIDPPPPEEPGDGTPWSGTMVTLEERPTKRDLVEEAERARLGEHFTGEAAHVISRATLAKPIVIAARPDAPAHAVIAALVNVGGVLAVDTPTGRAALEPAFRRDRDEVRDKRAWVEQLRDGLVDPSGGDGAPRADTRLDVLADPAMTAQELVAAIETARAAGWVDLGLGETTETPAERRASIAKLRGPGVRIGQPSANGPIAKPELKRTIRARETQLAACYARDRDGSGTVYMRFAVEPDGTPQIAELTGLTPDLRACVQRELAAMRFPVASEITEVSFPLAFVHGD